MTADVSSAPLTARNATLADLAALLCDQQARKVDVVAPAPAIRAEDGWLVLDGTSPDLGEGGVTMTAGRYPCVPQIRIEFVTRAGTSLQVKVAGAGDGEPDVIVTRFTCPHAFGERCRVISW